MLSREQLQERTRSPSHRNPPFRLMRRFSKWYQRRFGPGSKRVRKIGIVALARKLLVALWRFLETGLIPEGAVLKTDLRIRW